MSRFYPPISYYQPRCRFERLLIKIRIKVNSHSHPLFIMFRLSKARKKKRRHCSFVP
ncbi:hypothetical protein ERO13_A08G139301v2 [Gossypium hirsutum]|nr:hypothetical protein ERO13_A08G139301v2 [Gossypium hirsutum]